MIAWFASYPRSGNTFGRVVLQRMYNVPVTSFYYRPGDEKRSLFPEINLEISLDAARASDELVIFKTHELPTDDTPAIYVVRDGRDSLVSHAHYVLKYDRELSNTDRQQFVNTLRYLIESNDSFGGWGNNVLAWTKRQAPTAIVRFEELIRSPQSTLRAAVTQLQLPMTECNFGDVPEFSELHERSPNFFRRGSVGGWRDEMPGDLHELFWQRYGAAMDAIGYSRDGDSFQVGRRTTSAA